MTEKVMIIEIPNSLEEVLRHRVLSLPMLRLLSSKALGHNDL